MGLSANKYMPHLLKSIYFHYKNVFYPNFKTDISIFVDSYVTWYYL